MHNMTNELLLIFAGTIILVAVCIYRMYLDNKKKYYYFKGNKYKVRFEGKLKLNDEWQSCVVYSPMYICEDGYYFVRTYDDFYTKFKTTEQESIIAMKNNN